MMRKNRIRDKRGDLGGGGEAGGRRRGGVGGGAQKKKLKKIWGRVVARSGKIAGGAANAVCRL